MLKVRLQRLVPMSKLHKIDEQAGKIMDHLLGKEKHKKIRAYAKSSAIFWGSNTFEESKQHNNIT